MILCNYSYINNLCGHSHSGATLPTVFFTPTTARGYYTRQDETLLIEQIKRDSFQTGTNAPYTLILSDKGGLLSATTSVTGVGIFNNLNLAGGLNGVGALTGSGDLSGNLNALAFLISSLNSSSTLTGSINAAVSIAANLAGTGNLSGSISSLVQILANLTSSGDLSGSLAAAVSVSANLIGSGNLVGGIQALVQILANITGTSTLTGTILGNWNMVVALSGTNSLVADVLATAKILSDLASSGTIVLNDTAAVPGSLSAIIESCSALSPENLASAVWAALQTSINNPGTAGAALLAAGSAGDPWSTILPASYTGTQAGAILDRIQTLIDELHKIQGLDSANPMTVTPTQRTAGAIDMAITGDGETITIVTRQP